MQVQPYDASSKNQWDSFVAKSQNGTFLFFRDYMEYHSDRFKDLSLMIRDDKGAIISLLPANSNGNTVISHEGLTYGGFITDETMTTSAMLEVFENVIPYLREKGFVKFIYKTIPHIYHRIPAEEDLYCLFRHNAMLNRRDVLAVIDYSNRLKFRRDRSAGLRKAEDNKLVVKSTRDYPQFWDMLTTTLLSRYQAKPVHSRDEIMLLASRFPDNIHLVAAYCGDKMLAGVVVYLSPHVCHMQYSAVNDAGKKAGALVLVINYLIESYHDTRRFFDFGISNEREGHYLNLGLIDYKESFGARAQAHDFYEMDLTENLGWLDKTGAT